MTKKYLYHRSLNAVFVKGRDDVRVIVLLLARHEDEAVVQCLRSSVLKKLLDVHAVVVVHLFCVHDDENLARRIIESSAADQLNL